MKEPVVKYSPDGAVLLTCELSTHQAVVITFASHAALWIMHYKNDEFRTDIYIYLTILIDYL